MQRAAAPARDPRPERWRADRRPAAGGTRRPRPASRNQSLVIGGQHARRHAGPVVLEVRARSRRRCRRARGSRAPCTISSALTTSPTSRWRSRSSSTSTSPIGRDAGSTGVARRRRGPDAPEQLERQRQVGRTRLERAGSRRRRPVAAGRRRRPPPAAAPRHATLFFSSGSATVRSRSHPSFSSLMCSIAMALPPASRSGSAWYSETQQRWTMYCWTGWPASFWSTMRIVLAQVCQRRTAARPCRGTWAALAHSSNSGSWVTPRSSVIGSYLVRPMPLRMIALPPSLVLDHVRACASGPSPC